MKEFEYTVEVTRRVKLKTSRELSMDAIEEQLRHLMSPASGAIAVGRDNGVVRIVEDSIEAVHTLEN